MSIHKTYPSRVGHGPIKMSGDLLQRIYDVLYGLRSESLDIQYNHDGIVIETRDDAVGGALVKITGLHSDSPASGVRMYVGDVYGDGSGEDATTTGVTVRIPGIASDVTEPSYGNWSNLPICGAIPVTKVTWTGETEEHTETVYEVIGMLLLI